MMRLALLALGAVLLLAGCASPPASRSGAGSPALSGPGDYVRPNRDGAPWWDVDVSQVPDATPMPHYGRVKANPYTVMGKSYYPIPDARRYVETGTASWYGTKFHGQATANGESYDLYGMTAAHKTLPLPSYVKVTNLDNGRQVTLRVNDRGPFYSDRIIDLSFAAAKKLGYAESGTARVRVEGIDPHEWWAARGEPVPNISLQSAARIPTAGASNQPLEQYNPPLAQHAAAVLPTQMASTVPPAVASGALYLQVGAFANPDAAELLRAKLSETVSVAVFVSSVLHNQQILHRVRLGPIGSQREALQLQDSVRLANLGQPRLVRPD
jgi:rare lipoprotein A